MRDMQNILIVDDNAGILHTMDIILTEKGYRVEIADNGLDAIEQIRNRSFDLVISDIKMSHVTGVDVLKEIKRVSPEIPTIMITAFTMDKLVQEAQQEGAEAVLHKPLDFDELHSVILQLGAASQPRKSI
jgi:two-component system response regulator HydG